MMLRSTAVVFALFAFAFGSFAAVAARADELSAIKARGTLNVGVKADVLGFAYLDPKTEQYQGYEIDIARELAKRLLGDPNKVNFMAVTPSTRGTLLDAGEVDMIIATFSVTPERSIVYNFSPPYYTDGTALLVPKLAHVKSLSDLAGKPIGIAKDTTTASALMAKAGSDVLLTFAAFDTYSQVLNALMTGKVQAFATDSSILRSYAAQDPSAVILPERYSKEPYAVATKKGADALSKWVAAQITDLDKSGQLAAWQRTWKIYDLGSN
ncbi:MAG: transporter substrate-binding domain-containing protein [Candidatus Eremiobacteraeota bacterium]|nr:transporter substrate-binding domain-containing protein [Candidatus Eremiobacteraeota bacterium]MBV8366741.1 transporter substrate-binding domain-containing protein [Candidatus Eremiobacteraeota bacterium]